MGTATAITLRGRSVVALRAKLPLLEAGAPESWVEMAYESEWKGHHMGAFAFTPEALACIVARFDADENPIPVTYGHPDHGGGNPVPAAGWIQQMEVRAGTEGAELWGLVEWTAAAADLIRAGEYRYCSVVVDFAPVDRASGEPAGEAEMYELGLTNTPFLPGMQAITLSRVGSPARETQRTLAMATPMDPAKMVEGVAKSLGLKKDATLEEIKALLDAVFAFVAAMPGSTKGAPPAIAEAAAELSRVAKLSGIATPTPGSLRRLAAEMGGASIDEVLAACAACMAACEAVLDSRTPETVAACVAACKTCSTACASLGTAEGDACAKACDECVAAECSPESVKACLAACKALMAALDSEQPSSGMPSDAQAAQLSRTADAGRIVELSARTTAAEAKAADFEVRLAKYEAAEVAARIAASFSRLVAEGKAGEGERATFVALSAKSEEIALSAYDTRTPLLPPSGAPVVTGAAAAPGKVAGKVSASNARDLPQMFLSMAKADGLRGNAAEERAAVLLAAHNDRNSDHA